MGPQGWRRRAERLFDLAKRARDDGNVKWAEHLSSRAEKYLGRAIQLDLLLEREAPNCPTARLAYSNSDSSD
jgi:hypothetical protein